MSVDLSFMDLLFDKEDPVIGFDKDIKNEDLKPFYMDDKALNDDDWVCNADSFLDSIFQIESFPHSNDSTDSTGGQPPFEPFDLLAPDDVTLTADRGTQNATAADDSSCSDSGLSSDHQSLSPQPSSEFDEEIRPSSEFDDEIHQGNSSSEFDEEVRGASSELDEDVVEIKEEIIDLDDEEEIKSEPEVEDQEPEVAEQEVSVIADKPEVAAVLKKVQNQQKIVGSKPLVHRVMPVCARNNDTSYQAWKEVARYQQLPGATVSKPGGAVSALKPQHRPIGVTNPSSRHVLRVTPISTSANPRSILIPTVNLKTGNQTCSQGQVRTIKIVNGIKSRNAATIRATKQIAAPLTARLVTSRNDDVTTYPRLQLTAEEKRLMMKEGISLPSHYPLTKQEERELKRIRRKIRNKISAQDSRKRKKEYVDGLEDRVKQCTEENETLMKRLKTLQSQNQTLSTQLKRLQAALLAKCNATSNATNNATSGATTGATNTHAQPATCLMVLMLSLALVMAPNLRQQQQTMLSRDVVNVDENASALHGGSRSLLYTKQAADEMPSADASALMSDLEELIKFNTNNQLIGSGNKNQLIGNGDELIGGMKQLIGTNKQLIGGSSDHDYTMLSSSASFLSSANRKRAPLHYVVPPLDDDDRPPRPKKARGGDDLVEGWGKSGGELSAAIGSGRSFGVEGRGKSGGELGSGRSFGVEGMGKSGEELGSGRSFGVEGRGKSGGEWSVAMETDGGEVAMVAPINKSRNNEVIVRILDGEVF